MPYLDYVLLVEKTGESHLLEFWRHLNGTLPRDSPSLSTLWICPIAAVPRIPGHANTTRQLTVRHTARTNAL
jgi:hypothetical protein